VEKTGKAAWKPASVSDVSSVAVDRFFEPFPQNGPFKELALVNGKNFDTYPTNFGLPSRQEIEHSAKELSARHPRKPISAELVVNSFKDAKGRKMGVLQKVQFVLDQQKSSPSPKI
jgi:hypothetical protein